MRRSALFVLIAVVAALFAVPLTPTSSTAAVTGITFTVTSTDDTGDATPDGVCGPPCTLREAMQEANANNNDTLVDGISFAIPGDGPHTILPFSTLPTIEEPLEIDGYTQGASTVTTTDDAVENTLAYGTNAVLKIVIDGFFAAPPALGFRITSASSTIRGLVINGFQELGGGLGFGILIFGSGNVVEGNFIGTDVTGTSAVPNTQTGVQMSSGADGNRIGGSALAARNLISGNGSDGVFADDSDGDVVRGNLIGTEADGNSALGNDSNGVVLNASNSDVTDNVVAFNGEDGVKVFGVTGNLIQSNSIFSNAGVGIDLEGNARLQDRKDPDTAQNGLFFPNRYQNYPVVASAATSGTATTITGSLDSRPRKRFVLEFFTNSTPDGQGETFLGQATVRTNRKGRALFALRVGAVDVGDQVTATATHRNTGDTSEFSDPVLVTPLT